VSELNPTMSSERGCLIQPFHSGEVRVLHRWCREFARQGHHGRIAGRLLKSRGLSVSIQKLDPYINVDAGTMNPYQHGEVFVTEDGAETDLDLGHYERFIDEPLTPDQQRDDRAKSTPRSSIRSGAATISARPFR
jgi:hypothetical protein